MIDTYGRALYQRVIIPPLIRVFINTPPNVITFLALLAGISVVPLLANDHSIAAFLFLLLSGLLDTLDGSIARLKNETSPFGAALDICCDRIVEFSVIFGLYFVDPEVRSLNCLLMLGSILLCVTSFLVVGIFTQNQSAKSFHYSPGLMERSEAFLFFSIMILFPGSFIIASTIFVILTTATAILRLAQFKEGSRI